jgi:hypothetical protein
MFKFVNCLKLNALSYILDYNIEQSTKQSTGIQYNENRF